MTVSPSPVTGGFDAPTDEEGVLYVPVNLGDGRYGEGWSQHSYGNAGDYYGSPATLQALYLWLIANRQGLPIGTVCYNGQGPCSHPHTDHVHVDALPTRRGVPAGCG